MTSVIKLTSPFSPGAFCSTVHSLPAAPSLRAGQPVRPGFDRLHEADRGDNRGPAGVTDQANRGDDSVAHGRILVAPCLPHRAPRRRDDRD